MEVLNTKKHGGFLRNYRVLVDLNGIEPSTSRMRTERSPEWYLKRALCVGLINGGNNFIYRKN